MKAPKPYLNCESFGDVLELHDKVDGYTRDAMIQVHDRLATAHFIVRSAFGQQVPDDGVVLAVCGELLNTELRLREQALNRM